MANKTITQLTSAASVNVTDELEVQIAGENSTKKATIQQVLESEVTARAAQDDTIEASVGLNTNGSYQSTSNAWYMRDEDFTTGITDRSGATGVLTKTIRNALRILDAKIKAAFDIQNFWKRTETTLSPYTTGDNIETTGKVKSGLLEVGSSLNNVKISNTGNITFEGSATNFNIIDVPALSMRPAATGSPILDAFASLTLKVYSFDKATDESLYFNITIPHDYKQGTDLLPVIAFAPMASAVTPTSVVWGLEYIWQNRRDTASSLLADTILSSTIDPSETLVGFKHYIAELDRIDGTGKEINSILTCRVFRDADNKDDTFDNDAGLLSLYFIYERDTLGSNTESTK